ncbi:MAG: hypothetical protein ACK5NG_00115, partial [Chthoniobacterales bacterium]
CVAVRWRGGRNFRTMTSLESAAARRRFLRGRHVCATPGNTFLSFVNFAPFVVLPICGHPAHLRIHPNSGKNLQFDQMPLRI